VWRVRVLHCPYDVGGNASMLARGERALGVEADVMVFSRSWIGYEADLDLRLDKRTLADSMMVLGRALAGAARRYDIIHYNFGTTLLAPLPRRLAFLRDKDLPLLHALGKGIVVTYQGCDVRQKSECVRRHNLCACAEPDCYGGLCTPEVDARRAASARWFDKYADAVFALNPDLLWLLSGRAAFLPYTSVDLSQWVPQQPRSVEDGVFRVLHAPTDQGAKGTRYVVEAVRTLQQQHEDVELLLVENVPRSEAKHFYAQADILVDQLLVGWYGGLAVEAMALGKPVVAYIRETDLGFVPEALRLELPVVSATPDTIYQVLLDLYRRRDELASLGRRSRAFVEHWHDPAAVARTTKATYERILSGRRARRG
jgi:glycosyltransferase involved in cell wall biosynthesis